MPYAYWISARSVAFVATKRPPGCVAILNGPGPDRLGLTDATSNSRRGVCARSGAVRAPIAVGTTSATRNAVRTHWLRIADPLMNRRRQMQTSAVYLQARRAASGLAKRRPRSHTLFRFFTPLDTSGGFRRSLSMSADLTSLFND